MADGSKKGSSSVVLRDCRDLTIELATHAARDRLHRVKQELPLLKFFCHFERSEKSPLPHPPNQ
jgi:hypothetical protein